MPEKPEKPVTSEMSETSVVPVPTEPVVLVSDSFDAYRVGGPIFTLEELAAVKTFEDAFLLAGTLAPIMNAEDLGDGFIPIKKDDLLNVPMFILQWADSKDGSFLIIKAVIEGDNGTVKKVLFTDGSTGIARRLRQLTATDGRTTGIKVLKGLRKSDPYDVEIPDGKGGTMLKTGVITYYLGV